MSEISTSTPARQKRIGSDVETKQALIAANESTVAAAATYSPQQLKSVLETIAFRMRTLDLLLIELAERSYDNAPRIEMSTSIECAQLIANGIGAMADDAAGSGVFGNWQHWTFGANFATKGKAVQA